MSDRYEITGRTEEIITECWQQIQDARQRMNDAAEIFCEMNDIPWDEHTSIEPDPQGGICIKRDEPEGEDE